MYWFSGELNPLYSNNVPFSTAIISGFSNLRKNAVGPYNILQRF